MQLSVFIILAASGVLFAAFVYFAAESFREQEKRAGANGLAGALVVLLLAGLALIPVLTPVIGIVYLLIFIFGLLLFIPARPDNAACQGTQGHRTGTPRRFDERDTVFARYRSLPEGSDRYRTYYTDLHPERETKDALRRKKGFIGTPGSIDKGFLPNVAMMHAAFAIPPMLGTHARNAPEPGVRPTDLSPEAASHMVKSLARHIGADLVGITRVDPDLIYSHRGEIHYDRFDDWGQEISDLPENAVVMALEMNSGHVISAPHTPTVAESAHLYARGAYLSTLLAQWFVQMGYRGIAEHTRNYDLPLPPLAVDAGLGEVGRQGYLIAPKFGARVRLFAVLTDMPLAPDTPISLGADAFCQACKKCADSCPSKSIPQNEKTVHNGFLKWKLDEDSCFEYWGKVGTDCCICMAICPFSRPNTLLHRVVRWFVAHSALARLLFPHVDNFLYGKRWRPKKVASWLDYRSGSGRRQDKPETY